MDDLFGRINYLAAITKETVVLQELNPMMGLVMAAAKIITAANGVAIYVVTDDGNQLDLIHLTNDQMRVNTAVASTVMPRLISPVVHLYHSDGGQNMNDAAAVCVHEKKTAAYLGTDCLKCVHDSAGVVSQLIVPILTKDDRCLGCFVYVNGNERNENGFTEADIHLAKILAAQAMSAIEQSRLHAMLNVQTYLDELTGIPNKKKMEEDLRGLLSGPKFGHVFMLSIDHMKVLTTTQGFASGDRVIKAATDWLSERMADIAFKTRGHWMLYRFTSASWVLIHVADISNRDYDPQEIANGLLAITDVPLFVHDKDVSITLSIGIAHFKPRDDAATVLKQADAAMRAAKKSGDSAVIYDGSQEELSNNWLKIDTNLRRAIRTDSDNLKLHYQPKVDAQTGKIVGAEALMRWSHGGKMISPGEFIPVAEESGLILSLGEWALNMACRNLAHWLEEGLQPLPVSVNVSAQQFRQRHFVSMVRDIIESHRIPKHLIDLEVTEAAMANPSDAIRTLHELREMELTVSLDDFGTGFSSLSYLTKLPIDTLKIDQSFVRQMLVDPQIRAIVQFITNLGENLNVQIVGEGVETQEQHDYLRELFCQNLQGFLFSKPIPAAIYANHLRTGHRSLIVSQQQAGT